jgi:threonine dehydratase
MIATLSEQGAIGGVVAASAGNHAQGVAVAAKALGHPCTIVMPATAAIAKVEATRSYGANVILHGHDFGDAHAEARRIAAEQGLTFIPAYDDPLIVAGQGTLGLEIMEDMPGLDTIIVPVGGGGLASGIAIAAKARKPDVTVIGVQAEACPGAVQSLAAGAPTPVRPDPTIADGIAVPAPGQVTLPLLERYLDDMVTVSEEAISRAIVLLLERSKLVVEGAGAVGAAALLSGRTDVRGKKVCCVLSGGNVDVNLLARIVEHGLSAAGRYLTVRVLLDDRPGRLAHVLTAVAESGANVLDIEQGIPGVEVPLGKAEVQLLLELRNVDHLQEVTSALTRAGYQEGDRRQGVARIFVPAQR